MLNGFDNAPLETTADNTVLLLRTSQITSWRETKVASALWRLACLTIQEPPTRVMVEYQFVLLTLCAVLL